MQIGIVSKGGDGEETPGTAEEKKREEVSETLPRTRARAGARVEHLAKASIVAGLLVWLFLLPSATSSAGVFGE